MLSHDCGDRMQNEEIKDLESFLLDPNLELLEKKLSRFNLFTTLKVSHNEIVQSSVLRWILDPGESHGVGDYLLKKILKRVAIVNEDHRCLPMSPVRIDLIDMTDSFVQTEEKFPGGHRGDITLLDERNKIFVLFENKVRSREGKGQTKAYVNEVSDRYPSFKNFFIFLSPEGEPPEAAEFLRFSYRDLVDVLKDVLETKEDDLSDSSKFLIGQFVRNIEDNILEEGEIDKLCQEIYRKHKKAMDRIFLAKPENKQLYSELGELVKKELGEDWEYRAMNSYCAIYKESWRKKMNPDYHMPGFHYEFNDLPNRIKISIHIEALGGEDYRTSLKEALKKTDIGKKVAGIKWKTSQVLFSKIVVKNVEEDQNAVAKGSKEMQGLIKNTSAYMDKAIDMVLEKTKANSDKP